jgi:hypothetical protein
MAPYGLEMTRRAEDLEHSMTLCFVRAVYHSVVGPEWEAELQARGALHYLALLEEELEDPLLPEADP